jgi:hypothetical protein
MNYKCGHPAATINRLFGKIHPDRHVELLLIDQVYPTVPCYGFTAVHFKVMKYC